MKMHDYYILITINFNKNNMKQIGLYHKVTGIELMYCMRGSNLTLTLPESQ